MLGDEERRRVARLSTERNCRRGQVLFYQGEELAHLSCILHGHVKLFKTDPQGREMVIRFLGPGEVAGFRPLLADEPCAAAAECVTAARLRLVPRTLLLELVDSCRPFARHLLARLARELRESEERWLARQGESAERRVRRFLAQLAAPGNPAAAATMLIDVPKFEIARAADITPSTLSRILGRLAQRGLIRVEPRGITVLAARELERSPDRPSS
jgi:CRP/FNR family transcriptional regulator